MPHLASALGTRGKAIPPETRYEDNWPLHPFRLMDCHHLNGIWARITSIFPPLRVVIGSLKVEELGKSWIEVARRGIEMNLFVVRNHLAEFSEVVVDDLARARAPRSVNRTLPYAELIQKV